MWGWLIVAENNRKCVLDRDVRHAMSYVVESTSGERCVRAVVAFLNGSSFKTTGTKVTAREARPNQ